MATKHPRAQVTLKPEIKLIYKEAAQAMGMSESKLMADVLDEAAAHIRDLTKIIEKSQGNRLKALRELSVAAERVHGGIQTDIEDQISPKKKVI